MTRHPLTQSPVAPLIKAVGALTLLVSVRALALTEGASLAHRDVAFYTFALTATAFSLAIVVAYRAYAWVSYVVFAALMLLTVASMDGALAVFLGGGDFVTWVVPFLVYTLGAAYGCWVVATNLEPDHSLARFRNSFFALAGAALLLALSTPAWLRVIPLNLMWIPANVLFFVMLLGQCLPPLTWPELSPRLTLVTRAFPIAIGGYYAVVFFLEFIAVDLTQQQMNSANRLGLTLCAVFALTIVVSRAFLSAQQKEAAERRALQLAQHEAELQASLLEAERDYQRARSLAAKHQSQLASVSHDLKQPISALRMAIDGLPGDMRSRERLQQAVDYIGSLAHTFLDSAGRPDSAEPHAADPEQPDTVSTQVFADSLRQMFEGEAGAQGVALRIHSQPLPLLVEALPAMRVMSNLVGNALAHAQASRIVIAFRPRQGGVSFEVHDDGIGMSAQALEAALHPGARGEASDGHGLGLAIVRELCDRHGLRFDIHSKPQRGTSACVRLPVGELKEFEPGAENA